MGEQWSSEIDESGCGGENSPWPSEIGESEREWSGGEGDLLVVRWEGEWKLVDGDGSETGWC